MTHLPSLADTAPAYFQLGVEHVLLGLDHLLFVLALLLVVKGGKRLVGTVAAFTVAHGVALVAATLGWVTVPGEPVEAGIALSIVFVAIEIVRGSREQTGLTARAPGTVAFAFGLLHGFGFAGALHQIGLPHDSIATALVLFNLGVGAGQVTFVALTLGAIALLRGALARGSVPVTSARARWLHALRPLPAYAIGGVATFWTLERLAAIVERA
jgi:hydrogenase/urease accessory protein HupE